MNRIRFLSLATLIATVFLCGACSPPDSAAAKLKWEQYTEGLERGKKENKKILVKFHADWCTYCTTMDRSTYSDPEIIAYINKFFVPVEVDTDRNKGLAIRYRVNSLPLNLFLKPNGDQILPLPGFVPPKMFIKFLKWVAQDAYLETTLKDFVDKEQ
ncbi:MAG: thioredoxin family protein [Deltaproteobacteria bacterium]|nr:thioredoxin family protein [Deltaproteobacteria bacterium]